MTALEKIVWAGLSGLMRTAEAYDAAVAAVVKLTDGLLSKWVEHVATPMREEFLRHNPKPSPAPNKATKAQQDKAILDLADWTRRERNFKSSLSYLKGRAGLKIGARKPGKGKKTQKAKGETTEAVTLPGKITAETLAGTLRAILACTGWSVEVLEGKLALALTAIKTEQEAK